MFDYVTICLFALSPYMVRDAGPASTLCTLHQPILKDTKKYDAKASLCPYDYFDSLIKTEGLGFVW